MGDSSLSQDEIDALLQGADDVADSDSMSAKDPGGESGLSTEEQNALSEILTSSFNAAGTSIGAMLGGREVKITFSKMDVKGGDQIKKDFAGQFVVVEIAFSNGITGNNIFIFNQNDAIAIGSVLMGNDPSNLPSEMDDGLLQTFQEPLQIFVSSMATQMGNQIKRTIQTTPPDAKIISKPDDITLPGASMLVEVVYNLNISNLINSNFYHIIDLEMAKEISGLVIAKDAPSVPQSAAPDASQKQAVGQVGISPVKFPSFTSVPAYTGQGNIDLLMDVPMTLTVELGRAKMMIKDILSLGEGSIIELDKLAGEPVDLLINGKLIGKGEVVVIDENFGVRVTDIVSPIERVKQFGSG